MQELKFICCVDDQVRFRWEIRVYLNSLRKNGYNNIDVLVFTSGESLNEDWENIKKEYPEAGIFHYKDSDGLTRLTHLFNYIPLLRPYILKKHWEKFPELKDKAVFYTDSDIVFTRPLDFSPYLNDDICYLSYTGSRHPGGNYIDSDYFDSKSSLNMDGGPRYVDPLKFAQFKKRDVLKESAKICNITRKICEDNKNGTGGAQYLLKKINSEFWGRVLDRCMTIKLHLDNVNQQFMQGKTAQEKENNGFQSYCADMWAVLWTLWEEEKKTLTPKELDFAWSTDEIASHTHEYILHNAGMTSDAKIRTRIKDENKVNIEVEAPAFFKGAYNNRHPMEDFYMLTEIINNPVSSRYHTSTYVKEILDTFK